MSLTVTIPDTFNGPLDLLLHLIRRDEMDIYDIPIARLTKSYLEEMRNLDIVNVDEAAEFLDLASRLLEIKSRMLVPPDELPDETDEDEDEFDPRSDLVASLLEYRRFKDAAKLLGDMADEQARRYPRVAPRFDFQLMEDAPASDSMDLMQAFQNMLLRLVPQSNESNVITYTEVPTSIRIEQIVTVLEDIGTTRFSKLLSGTPDRREMVGFFIAILELVRQGRVIARQSDNFSDIVLEHREAAKPVETRQAEKTARRRRAPRCFSLSLSDVRAKAGAPKTRAVASRLFGPLPVAGKRSQSPRRSIPPFLY